MNMIMEYVRLRPHELAELRRLLAKLDPPVDVIGGYVGGVYDGTNRGVTVVGTDLPDFLERLLDAVTRFAPNGDVKDI